MMSKDQDSTVQSDDPVEQLLANAEPRPTPPPEVVAAARNAVMAEWKNVNRRRQQRWLAVAAGVVFAATLWFSMGNEIAPDIPVQVASIDKVSGEFDFREDDGLLERRPQQRQVHVGETIVTDAGATLGLAWNNGGSLRLDAETAVRFLQGDEIELLSGRVYFDSQFGDAQPLPLTIHTSYGDVRHLGTQFMTDIRSGDMLRVSVREGEVSISGIYHDASVAVGKQVVLHGSREPLVTDLATHSAEWQWVQSVAPAVSMDGKSFLQLLEWVCRETGMTYRIESGMENANFPLTAGVEGNDPMALLRVGAVSVQLSFQQINGVIVVNQGGP